MIYPAYLSESITRNRATIRFQLPPVWSTKIVPDAAVFTNRVAHGCDSCYVRGLLEEIRRSTFPTRDDKISKWEANLGTWH